MAIADILKKNAEAALARQEVSRITAEQLRAFMVAVMEDATVLASLSGEPVVSVFAGVKHAVPAVLRHVRDAVGWRDSCPLFEAEFARLAREAGVPVRCMNTGSGISVFAFGEDPMPERAAPEMLALPSPTPGITLTMRPPRPRGAG